MVKRAFADPALATHSAVVREFHQHRPAAAAECLLFLRRVARRAAGRADRVLHAERQFRRHDGRDRRAANGFADEKNHRAGERQRRVSEISCRPAITKKLCPSRNSLSNAMNVGHPSNLARLVAVYGGRMDETGKIHRLPDLAAMRRDLFSTSVSDERTRAAIREVWNKFRLLLEPHGAVAWRGFQDWLDAEEPLGETFPRSLSRPRTRRNFPEEIEKVVGWAPDVPREHARRAETAGRFRPHGTRTTKNSGQYLLQRHTTT